MKTLARLLPIFSALIFCSCESPTRTEQAEKTVDSTTLTHLSIPSKMSPQTDSAKIAKYFQWTESIDYLDAYAYDISVLERTEKNRDTMMLLHFLTANYDSVKLYEEFPYPPSELVKYVFAIDFNGDELLDMIYDGPSGGEPNITQFFLNQGDHYKKVFSSYQDVCKATFSGNKLTAFTLVNPGCCADPQIVQYDYSVSYVGKEPTFILDKTLGYVSRTEKPQNAFSTPQELTIQTNKAKLRSDCYVLDNVEHPAYGGNGNAIATYKRGSKGKALGAKNDQGIEWVYVIMNANSRMDSCEFPTFLEQPTAIKGWMRKDATDLK